MTSNDPIGLAIWDFYTKNQPEDIVVECDILDNDFIPIDYLFRDYSQFPALEKEAMKHVKGKVLDIGAAAGPHSEYLSKKGFEITTLEKSKLAHRYLKEKLPYQKHVYEDIFNYSGEQFDTILLLMNGIGIAQTYSNVVPFLKHLANLLSEDGQILCESTDVLDVFEDEEGGFWIDLNAEYYGEFNFNMKYKNSESGWFNWVYLDRVNFEKLAKEAGLKISFIFDDKNSFLVKLKK